MSAYKTDYSVDGQEAATFPAGASYSPPNSRPREYLVLDFETTGLNAGRCEIIEIGCVRVFANSITGKFSTLVRSETPAPKRVLKLTGIREEEIAAAPTLDEAVAELAAFIGSKPVPIFAHKASFEARFIWEAGIADAIEPDCPLCCSLELARRELPCEPSHSLDHLAKSQGLIRFDAHRAIGDCLCTAQLIDVCYAEGEAKRKVAKNRAAQGQLSLSLSMPPCPKCGSVLVAKDGFTQAGTQMYRCKECNKKYTDKTVSAVKRKVMSPTFSEAQANHPDGRLPCKHCGSTNIIVKEHKGSRHRYLCKDCRRTMTFRDG